MVFFYGNNAKYSDRSPRQTGSTQIRLVHKEQADQDHSTSTVLFINDYIVNWNFFMIMRLHSLSLFAVKAKIYGELYKQSSAIAFDETSSY